MHAVLVIQGKTFQSRIQTKNILNLFYRRYQERRQFFLEQELPSGCFCRDITLCIRKALCSHQLCMRASKTHFPNDLCTHFSAQFSIPLSFPHMCKSRTSKKRYSVLEDFGEDCGGSEMGNDFIDLSRGVHSRDFRNGGAMPKVKAGGASVNSPHGPLSSSRRTRQLSDFRTALRCWK